MRSRISLFATSSLVATSLAAGFAGMGGLALTPSVALAANECGDPTTNGATADTFNCAPATYPTGIVYPVTDGALTLNLQEDATGAVKTTTGGVQVTGAVGDTITITRSASATGTGDPSIINGAGSGIGLTSPNSNLTIDLTDPDTGDTAIAVTGSTNGISAVTGAGNVSVKLSNGTVTGQAGDGIDAVTLTGAINVNTGAATVNASNTGPAGAAIGIAAGNLVSLAPGFATDGITITGTGAINATSDAYAAVGIQAVGDGVITINETGPITAKGDFAFGVAAVATNAKLVDITTQSIVVNNTGAASGGDGIFVYSVGPVKVTSGTISTTGLGASGIRIGPQTGNLPLAGDTKVVSGTITTTGDDSPGIEVYAHGSVDITSASVTTTGKTSTGIAADSDLSTVSINSGVVSATGAGSVGIRATGSKGVTIATTGATTADDIGISANSFAATDTGAISITAGGDVTSKTDDAISVSNTGLGAVSITTAAGTTLTSGDDAISAFINNPASKAPLSVTVNGALNPNSASGVGYGVFSGNNGTGGSTITISSTGSVTGRADYGVSASLSGATGDLSVINNGAIGTAADAVDLDGINVSMSAATTGKLSVSGTGSINATNFGIFATNAGTGTTTVGGGAITSGDDGINVTSKGAYTVNANGSIKSGANAIQTNGTVGGTINVGTGAVVQGVGSTTVAVIDATSPAGQVVTLNNAGTIRSNNASVTAAANDLAVKVTGGQLVVNNTGRIDGHLDLTAATAPLNFKNGAGGNWHIAGTQTLTAGNDVVNNGVGGLVATQGATTLDFGADTGVAPRDVFTNAGTVVAGETTGASTFTVTGLESFNNSGSVVFGSANGGTSSDGQTNDRIVMTGTGGGTAFVGSGASVLVMDANLGVTTQTNCAAATTADCLSLPGGSFSGTNKIRINNTSTTPGGLNTTGIVVVEAGSVAPGSFTLDTGSSNYTTRGGVGAVDTGLFFYRLVPIGTTQVALVSAPDNEVFEFTTLGMQATDVWYTTTGTWFDRQADLRDGPLNAGSHPGVWLKAVGDWTSRKLTQSTVSAGTTFLFNTGYNQNTAALIGGIDVLHGGGANSAWVLGLDGGYVDSNVRMTGSPTRADLTGSNIGVYGSFVSGPWYLDATGSGDFLNLDWNIPSLAPTPGSGAAPFHTQGDVRTWGGQVESGWRAAIGGGTTFIEPFGSLSYVRTKFDSLALPGGNVAFNNVTSFRGSLGLRLSSTWTIENVRAKTTIYARGWDEWRGSDQIVLTNPGAPILAGDRFKGAFADVGGNMALFSSGGLSGFVNAGYKWKSGYHDSTVTIGARYQF